MNIIRKLFLYYRLFCKRLLRKPSFLFILLLLPLSLFALSHAGRQSDSTVAVALYVAGGQEADPLSSCLVPALLQHEGLIRFYLADSREALYQDVASKEADCGYLIPEELSRRLEKGSLRSLIETAVSPGTTAFSVSREVLFSRIMEIHSAQFIKEVLAADHLLKDLDQEALYQQAIELYQLYLAGEATFSFDYSGDAAPAARKDQDYLSGSFEGLLALFILLAAMTGGLNALKDQEQRIFTSIAVTLRPFLPFLTILAPASMAAAAAALCLLLLPDGQIPLLPRLIMLAPYTLLTCLYCLFLITVSRTRRSFAPVIPFMVLGSLIFSPVFIDLSLFLPVLRLLSLFFPPSWYLRLLPL